MCPNLKYSSLRHSLACCLLLAFIHTSYALESDRLQQIDIEADQATFNELKGITTYEGNVILSQGSLELKASSMTIRQTKQQTLKDIKANGSDESPVTMQQQVANRDGTIEWVNASATTLIYSMKHNQIEFIDQAHIHKGDATISSNHIKYDANKGIFQASNPPSDNNTSPANSRVRISLPAQTTEQAIPKNQIKEAELP